VTRQISLYMIKARFRAGSGTSAGPHGKLRAARARGAILRAVRGVVFGFPRQIGHELRGDASRIEIIAVERNALGCVQVSSPGHRVVDEVVARGIVLGHGGVVEQPDGFAVEQSAKRAVPPLDERALRDRSHGGYRLNGRYRRRPGLCNGRNAGRRH